MKTSMAAVAVAVTVVAAATAVAAAAGTDPLCLRLAEPDTTSAEMIPWNITVDLWDAEAKEYHTAATIIAHAVASKEGEFRNDRYFGISNHAPNVYGTGHNAADPNLPPVFFGLTFKNKYLRLDNVPKAMLGEDQSFYVDVTTYAWALAPSGMYNVDDADGNLVGFLTGGGNPFIMNFHPDGTSPPIPFKGSVAMLYDNVTGENCPMVFPDEDLDDMGKVVNTVKCHEESGVCYFSVWKFMDPANVLDPDCFYWCIVDDVYNPTTCVHYGIVPYPDGEDICMTPLVPDTHYGGGVHGFTTGRTSASSDQGLDIFLFFTGGPEVQGPGGVSSMMKLEAERVGNTVITHTAEYMGEQLWNDTVELPFDVGLDHGYVQPDSSVIWISHFRDANPGISAVDYDSGDLILTLHGFTTISEAIPNDPDYYVYPSGINGYLGAGDADGILVLPTSTLYGLQPPIPDECVTSFDCGTGPTFIIPIADIDIEALRAQAKALSAPVLA